MKVLLVDQIYNVNFKHSDSFSLALQYRGITVDIVKWFNSGDKNCSKIKKIENYFKSYKRIIRTLNLGEYDVLHLQWYILSPIDYYYIRKIKKLCTCQVVQTIHDVLPFDEKFFDRFFYKELYRLCDKLIVSTEENRNRLVSFCPEIENKVNVIPNGNYCNHAKIIKKRDAREYLKIADDKVVLLFYGQLKKVKGLRILLEALGKMSMRESIILVVAGTEQGDSVKNYKQIIKRYNLDKMLIVNNKYIDFEEEKYYFSAADIVVLPYTNVYQSGVVQLAFAYSRPVIASDIPGFRDIVHEGDNGYLFETEKPDSLAKVIERAIKEEKINEMGERGLITVKEDFSWDRVAEQYYNIYSD